MQLMEDLEAYSFRVVSRVLVEPPFTFDQTRV